MQAKTPRINNPRRTRQSRYSQPPHPADLHLFPCPGQALVISGPDPRLSWDGRLKAGNNKFWGRLKVENNTFGRLKAGNNTFWGRLTVENNTFGRLKAGNYMWASN